MKPNTIETNSYPNSKSIPSSFPIVTANPQAAARTNTVPPMRIHFVVSVDSDDADVSLIPCTSLSIDDDDNDDDVPPPPTLAHTSSTS